MPKARVRVTLVAETTVEMEVDYAEGEDSTNLTSAEERAAINQADPWPDWIVDDVEVIK